MKPVKLAFAISVAGALSLPVPAFAGPLVSPGSMLPAIQSGDSIVKVNGCHRNFRRHYSSRYGRVTRHRHKQSNCRATKKPFKNRHHRHRNHGRGNCLWIDGVVICF